LYHARAQGQTHFSTPKSKDVADDAFDAFLGDFYSTEAFPANM
jgi:hypothetical protein